MSGDSRAVLMATIDLFAMAWWEMNDSGNADRLVARAGGLLLHVREWGWVAYDGVRWSTDDGERLAALKAMEVARGMRDEIEALAEVDDRALPEWCSPDMRAERVIALRKHKVTSGNSTKTTAMLAQAAHLDVVNRRMDAFDHDPLTINAANRTLRFVRRDGAWRMEDAPHDPADLLTRALSCPWNPDARNELWARQMDIVLPDPQVRWFFQKLMGYCLTGKTDEQIFILLQGKGGDGKSTVMNVIRTIMGGYAVSGNVKAFLDGQQQAAGAATNELMRFVGDTRLISLQEPKRGPALAEERVKQFTGGSPVPARGNYGDEFEFDPRGKVVMEVNARPRISGDDDGIWRRIIIVLFPQQFKAPKAAGPGSGAQAEIKGMTGKLLEAGREGILNWLLAGVQGYLDEGLEPPPAVADAIEEYRRSSNPFSEWMAARADTSDPSAVTLASALYKDYKEWCEAENVGDREIISPTAFGRAMGDRQILLGPRDRTGKKTRRGIRLRGDEPLPMAKPASAAPPPPPDDDDWLPP